MALEQKTTKDIYDLIINQMESEMGKSVPILPKSFICMLAKVLAGTFMILYKVCDWIFLQMFVSTASFDEVTILNKRITPLVEWGRLIGVGDPSQATEAVIKAEVTISDSLETEKEISIPSGTQFISSLNGLVYTTQKSYILKDEITNVELVCSEKGIQGNLSTGETLNLSNTLGYVKDLAVVKELVSSGKDRETEGDYRKRIISRFQFQPHGGSLSDYKQWALEVPGVKNAYVYTGEKPGHVLVYVLADENIYPDRVPDKALLKKVGEAIDKDPITGLATRKPITSIIDPKGDKSYENIKAVKVVEFDAEITEVKVEDLVDISKLIKNAIKDYYLEREPYLDGLSMPPSKDTINITKLTAIVDDILTAHNGTFTAAINIINVSVDGKEISQIRPKYVLNLGEVAKLKTLKINWSEV